MIKPTVRFIVMAAMVGVVGGGCGKAVDALGRDAAVPDGGNPDVPPGSGGATGAGGSGGRSATGSSGGSSGTAGQGGAGHGGAGGGEEGMASGASGSNPGGAAGADTAGATGHAGAAGGSGGVGGGASGAGGATGRGGAGGDGTGAACSRDQPCGPAFYCTAADQCGSSTSPYGLCQKRPDSCPTNVDPVCGCDGQVYNNACEANRLGHLLSSDGRCPTPAGMFPCGYGFCAHGVAYCAVTIGSAFEQPSVPYSCVALPAACMSAPTCSSCFASASNFSCSMSAGGDLTKTIYLP